MHNSGTLHRHKIVKARNGMNGVTVEIDDKKGSIYLAGDVDEHLKELQKELDVLKLQLKQAKRIIQEKQARIDGVSVIMRG